MSLTHSLDSLEIHLDRRPNMGCGLLGLDHVLGDTDPDAIELDFFAAHSNRGRRCGPLRLSYLPH